MRTAFAEEPETTVLAVGATAGKAYEDHGWELWFPLHEMFQAGDYEGVIAKGRESIEANPQYGMPLYNLACAESLGGHPQDAIRHLGMAIERWDGARDLAREDNDFDAIRDERSFPRTRRLNDGRLRSESRARSPVRQGVAPPTGRG